jgi:hypothetical protein
MTFRSSELLVTTFAIAATLSACGSGMTSGVLRGRDYDKYLEERTCFEQVEFFKRPPPREHAVVGTIELRTSRIKSMDALQEELEMLATQLKADALVAPESAARTAVEGSVNPLRPFYVFDDGRTQILEARAIRYARSECVPSRYILGN